MERIRRLRAVPSAVREAGWGDVGPHAGGTPCLAPVRLRGGGAGQSASEVRAAPCPAWRCRPGADAATCVVARGRTPARPSLPPCGRPAGWAEGGALSVSVGTPCAGRAWTALPWLPCRASVGGLGACVAGLQRRAPLRVVAAHSIAVVNLSLCGASCGCGCCPGPPAAPGPGRAPRDARGDGNTLKISLETRRKTLSVVSVWETFRREVGQSARAFGATSVWGRGLTLVSEKGTLF